MLGASRAKCSEREPGRRTDRSNRCPPAAFALRKRGTPHLGGCANRKQVFLLFLHVFECAGNYFDIFFETFWAALENDPETNLGSFRGNLI